MVSIMLAYLTASARGVAHVPHMHFLTIPLHFISLVYYNDNSVLSSSVKKLSVVSFVGLA